MLDPDDDFDDDDFNDGQVDFEDSTADWQDEIDAVDVFDIEYDR